MTKLRALGLLVTILVLLVIFMFMLVAPVALAQQCYASPPSTHATPAAGEYTTGLSNLPPQAQSPISAALGKDDSAYWIYPTAAGLRGENPRQALTTDFTKQGAEVRIHDLRWRQETRAYGYGDALRPVKTVAPHATADRVDYRRDGLAEWYENGPLGLEQGFTLAHPPGAANGQPLTVELALRGDLVAVLEPGGKGLELKDKSGKAALRYRGLEVRDATGRELRSWLEVRGERLMVRVDDGGARYPVSVDPWIQQAELSASNGAANDWFGYSVAISGSTVVVGAPGHYVGSNYWQGAAWVFVESSGTWSQQAELLASDGATNDAFGTSVAVSGATVVVGAQGHKVGSNSSQGAAYVFTKSAGTWSQKAELTASDGATNDLFGTSVAFSGSTAVVGAPQHTVGLNPSQGAAYVFVKSGGTWNQQAELTASDGAEGDGLGYSVAFSGSTTVVGAWFRTVGSNELQGAAYVFTQSAGTWSQQAELIASDGASWDWFGSSVAVSGATAVVGAPLHTVGLNPSQGAAYVFVKSGGTWSQQAELAASNGTANDWFGTSVAVSDNTVAVGATYYGAAYVFTRSGGVWSQQADLTLSGWEQGFGNSVVVRGGTVVVGDWGHTIGSNYNQGAAYVFVSAVTLSPTELNFTKQALNTTSKPRTVTVTNTGTATLDISSITASDNFAISSMNCGTTLAPGKACTVNVTFTPIQAGWVVGTLSVADTAVGSPQTVALSGTSISPGEEAYVAPGSIDFGEQIVGTTSAAQKISLFNIGTQQIEVTNVAATGDFSVTTNHCMNGVKANTHCDVYVIFSPTQTGTRSGELTFTDSATDSPQTASLAGTGD